MKILKYPDPVLLARAKPVPAVTEELRELVAGMLQAMAEARGLGLAAPQVGVSQRLIVINTSPGNPDTERAYINPEIVWSEGEATAPEGCLSLPGVNGKITRAARVRVTALDLDAKPLTIDADGMLARVLQHEIDHLDGVLILSKFSAMDKAANARSIRDLEKNAKLTRGARGR